jgi:disulfide bond formation protein DsbB
MSFLSSFLISCYHFGVEQDFFDGTLVCQIKGLGRDISTSELLRELESNKSKSCKDVDFRVFGLSLATINLFISFVLSTITFNKIFKK